METKNIFKVLLIVVIVSTIAACQKTDTSPSTSDRDKYLGTWQAVSNGSGGTRNFNLVITASLSAQDQIKMEHFDGAASGLYVFATVSGNSILINSQVVNGETIAGTGSYVSTNHLSFDFTVNDGQTTENRTCTASK